MPAAQLAKRWRLARPRVRRGTRMRGQEKRKEARTPRAHASAGLCRERVRRGTIFPLGMVICAAIDE